MVFNCIFDFNSLQEIILIKLIKQLSGALIWNKRIQRQNLVTSTVYIYVITVIMLWQIGSLVHVAITLSCQINVPWYLVYCSSTGYSLCLTGVCHESVRENRNTVAITLWADLYIVHVTPNLVIHKNTFVNSDRLYEHFIVPIPKWAKGPFLLGRRVH